MDQYYQMTFIQLEIDKDSKHFELIPKNMSKMSMYMKELYLKYVYKEWSNKQCDH